MNPEIITKIARATLAGTISFPEVVSQLLAAGVEYYHVDYVTMRKTFYGANGETVVTPINYEGLPPVAVEFDAPALRADILDSQRNEQKYRDFTRRAMEAGTQSYFAFLRGKRVTYIGRQGDQHGSLKRVPPRAPHDEQFVLKWLAAKPKLGVKAGAHGRICADTICAAPRVSRLQS